MTGDSLNIQLEQLEKLKQIFPETVTEGKIDWEKLQVSLGKQNIEFNNERYVLNWAGKTEAFKVLQQSTSATLKPVPEESINFDTTENVFIEGENLEVLKVLQKSYYGKVKVVIIDPPYNTGNDSFIYPDSFKESRAEYEKRIGDKDEDGYLMKEGFFRKNSRDSGHYHSNWLSMMYPRLFLAKNLLRDDGVIFVHIDDNEVHNLRMMMNEIFGEENFVAQIIWKNVTDNNPTLINLDHEYILCYSKNKSFLPQSWKSFYSEAKDMLESQYQAFKKLDLSTSEIEKRIKDFISDNFEIMGFLTRYKNVDENGVYTGSESVHNPKAGGYIYDIKHPETGGVMKMPANGYRFPYATFIDLDKQKKIIYGEDEFRIIKIKKYLDEFEDTLRSIITMDGRLGSYDLKRIFIEKVFNNPKPIELLSYLISFVCDKNDTILDFFSGSGTTAEAVIKLNRKDGGKRKFILVQLPEICDEISEAFKAGYKTIADITKERIRRVILKIENEKSEKVEENFKYNLSISEIKLALENQKTHKPELDFENIDVSSESKKILDKIKFLEKKIEQNEDLISKIDTIDLGFKSFRLASSNFKIWRGNEITQDNLEQQLAMFTDPVLEGSENENMLYELMIKAGYLLTDKVTVVDNYYSVNDGELIIALETMNKQLIDTILAAKPKKVITLDKLFTGNDQLKTNAVLQMRDGEVDFKTI